MTKKNEWKIVHDMDDDDGNPTGWSLEINHKKYGKYIWITINSDGKYHVEAYWYYGTILDDCMTLAECKSLASAKRWVAMNLL